jgi:hypothetical protein
MLTLDRAAFDKLSLPLQALIFIALPFPLFFVFAMFGDLARGALVWFFSIGLLNAQYACRRERNPVVTGLITALLVVFHAGLVVWDPLRHVRLLGGLFLPIVTVDYCIDYAVFWVTARIFKHNDFGAP